jgi:arginine utilization regulatory protein
MLEIKERIMRIAKTDSSVLIFGETGTGKELVAQSIHAQSRRNQMPFVSFNCAAVPENLLESILFGTVKGAFTGAENSQGIIAQANGGTLFLDELHTMSFSTQAKLLRFLEDRRIRRVGDHLEKSVDIRVISAINLPPMEAVEKKLIREDLFYRLSVVSIHIPPLRERPTDIPALTDYFIHGYNESMNRSIQGVSDLVMNLFREYAWKGNVRELRHTIEGAFNLAKGDVITLKDLPDYMVDVNASSGLVIPVSESISSISLEEKLRDYEKGLICRALAENESYAEAARKLGITRQSLRYKIEKFCLHK